MEDWMNDAITALGEALKQGVVGVGEDLANSIFDGLMKWLYESIYGALGQFFETMGNMGAEIFDLSWVEATIKLFTLVGWALFSTGTVVAVFDTAIEFQNGGGNIKQTALNILKGFFAANLVGVLPVELYKFCISLQNTFSKELSTLVASEYSGSIKNAGEKILEIMFDPSGEMISITFFLLALLIAFAYSIINVFFQNIKRGGILLIQMCVGSLYMFSLPRGYDDGFNSWVKQVCAICLTAFMQTTMLYLGLVTFQNSMILGIGIMLAAGEVPRIAQQFGLDSSMKVNMSSAVMTTSTIVSTAKRIVA